jgi:signal transduction histidine kinase
MRALARYASAVRTGALSNTVPPDQFGTREIQSTAAAVIDMAEALKTRETTIRSYSDHVTHELKGPVSAVVAAAELLQDRDLATADRALVDQIAGAAAQMNTELDALRRVVRAREANYQGHCRLADILPALQGKDARVTVEVSGAETSLPLAPEGLTLILDHLVSNAASHGATRVEMRAHGLVIDISDDGAGIPEGDRSRIFEPFFTTRRDSGGTGMGLAIVRSILAAHGGNIVVMPTRQGAAFRIEFANS